MVFVFNKPISISTSFLNLAKKRIFSSIGRRNHWFGRHLSGETCEYTGEMFATIHQNTLKQIMSQQNQITIITDQRTTANHSLVAEISFVCSLTHCNECKQEFLSEPVSEISMEHTYNRIAFIELTTVFTYLSLIECESKPKYH